MTQINISGKREKGRLKQLIERASRNPKIREALEDNKSVEETKTPEYIEEDQSVKTSLVVAAGNKIYCVEPGKTYKVVSRPNTICALVSHHGRLCDGGDYKTIRDTLSDDIIAFRQQLVQSLVSHAGRLYDAGTNNMIIETLSGKVITPRSDWVYALASHNGKLYDGGVCGIFDTLKNENIVVRPDWIRTLVSHDGRLYDAGVYGIFDTLDDGEVASRRLTVNKLISHNGKLYDGGDYKAIYATLGDPKGEYPLWTFDKPVNAMASISAEHWEELARKGQRVND